MKFARIIEVVGLALASTVGMAQTVLHDDSRWFDGAGVVPLALYTTSHVTTYKVFGGLDLPGHFALEASYFDPRKFAFSTPVVPNDTLAGRLRARGFGIDGVGLLPFTPKFGFFARVGGTYAESIDSFSAFAGLALPSRLPREWRANPRVGAGLQYLFARNCALRGEWERYRISEAGHGRGNFDAWIIDLVFKIGGTPASRADNTRGFAGP